MKSFSTLLLSIITTWVFSQGTGIVNPILQKHRNSKALVIGISDYQHIKGLRFADKDAQEFASFLKENNGWGLQEENIQVLTNENARQGDILTGLQWIMDAAEPGEDVIFYFSGHGDVEKVGEDKKGFLLAHDAPKNNYPIGGTVEVSLLDSVFVQLINKDIKVWVLIDACRSGNLAGGLSGTKQTTEALAKQWNNQIRMLSAQPDQLSFEDPKWGGGRGVFSYYLVKGMSGYANANADPKITLNELESYLGNNITVQTEYAQQPHIEGPNPFTLGVSRVDSLQMQRYLNDHIEGEVSLAMVAKSGEYSVAEACSEQAEQFVKTLTDGLTSDRFYSVSKSWLALNTCTNNEVPLQLRYQYSRALINQINQVVNLSLTGEKLSLEDELKNGIHLIDELKELNKGRNFIGKEHFERVKHYLKTVLLSISTVEELTELKLPYLIEVAIEDPDLFSWNDVEGFQADMEFYGNYNVKVLEAESDSLTYGKLLFESDFFYAPYVMDALSLYLDGPARLSVLLDGDTLLISTRPGNNEKEEKHITSRNLFDTYVRILLSKLSVDCKQEPNAAYLYYSRAILYNKLQENDSALIMLDSCIALSPKWLNPLYAKGAILRAMKQNKSSIETFEKVFELEPLYQEFECVDCFFMGLINLYLKEKKLERIDPAIDRWLQMRKDDRSRSELYFQLFADRSSKRSQKKFWLKKIEDLSDLTLDDQFRWLSSYISVHKRKYSDKELLEFSRIILSKLAEGEAASREFFEKGFESRTEHFENPIVADFFSEGKSYLYKDPLELIEWLAILLYEKNSGHVFNQKELTKEYFALSGMLHLKDIDWYNSWAYQLVYLKRRNDQFIYTIIGSGPYADYETEAEQFQLTISNLEAELLNIAVTDTSARAEKELTIRELKDEIEELRKMDAAYNYALIFGYDPELFNTIYVPLYPKGFFFQFMNSIAEQSGFQDEKVLQKMCKTYSDQEKLKNILMGMHEFYSLE